MLKTPGRILAFDTETTGLFPWPTLYRQELGLSPDRPFLFTLANMNGDTAHFRAEVDSKTRAVDYSTCEDEVQWLRDYAGNSENTVVMHNARFDVAMTVQPDLHFKWRCRIEDTRTLARVANPSNERQGYGLKPLAAKYLDIPDDDLQALRAQLQQARRAAKIRGWSTAATETHGQNPASADYWLPELRRLVLQYGLTDSIRTIGLFQFYTEVLKINRGEGGKLYQIAKWENAIMRTAIRMEQRGMTYLDTTGAKLKQLYERYMADQLRAMQLLGYADLNPSSSKQLSKIFVTQMGRVTEKRTPMTAKGGGDSPKIDAEQLMVWARGSGASADVDGDAVDGCKLSRALLEWKAGKKVIEYVDSYEFFKCRRDDGSAVLHPAWDPAGARTGRFSCHDPNTQQIASAETSRRHSRIRARQREAFGPRPGYVWYMPDYSQIEVFIFAFAAQEETMMKALLDGADFHLSTAFAAWGDRSDFCTCGQGNTAPRKVHTKACLLNWWRQRAKMILFSKLFGGGLAKIAELIRCPEAQAREFVRDFETRLPGVRRYMDNLVTQVRQDGILVNLFGREYPIESDRAYKAVNYMVQGSAAEIMKRGTVRVDRHLRAHYPGSCVVGTVHDEMIAEIKREHHSRQLMREMIALMQEDSHYVPNLPVLLPVKMNWTHSNWHMAQEIDLDGKTT
jgi:DNA polymerase I-like protein with 3'-5' exonuclease and polymerase domains